MNFLNEVAGVTAFESERLRRLYADGKPLPPMPVPDWVRLPEATELGMVRLPHVALSGGGGPEWSSPTGMVFLVVISICLLYGGYDEAGGLGFSDNAMTLIAAGYGLLLFTAIGWIDCQARSSMAPESSSIEYSPGDTVLVMLPRRPRSTSFVRAKLLFQERWYVEQGKSSHWMDLPLKMVPVSFAHSGARLMTAAITLPVDAPASYHTTNYRHEWVLAITHVAWWGSRRTDHYLLWVAPMQQTPIIRRQE